jgi:hypothetical protein
MDNNWQQDRIEGMTRQEESNPCHTITEDSSAQDEVPCTVQATDPPNAASGRFRGAKVTNTPEVHGVDGLMHIRSPIAAAMVAPSAESWMHTQSPMGSAMVTPTLKHSSIAVEVHSLSATPQSRLGKYLESMRAMTAEDGSPARFKDPTYKEWSNVRMKLAEWQARSTARISNRPTTPAAARHSPATDGTPSGAERFGTA